MKPLYEFSPELQMRFIEGHLNSGRLIGRKQGTFADIFFLDNGGQRFAAKCPKINRFGNAAEARSALEQAIVEIENTVRYQQYAGVNRFGPLKLVLGWPFYLSSMRDGTLSEMIATGRGEWNDLQKLATLIQIAHTLNYCGSLGLSAHQDLKPENILIGRIPLDSLSGKINPATIVGFTTVAYVSDFGMADAFRHIGRNSGSRPYMAPEQYEREPLVDGSKIDVFALGVIAFELFADGLHPVGERTSEVWPEKAPGKPSKWNHENVWKNWSRGPKNLAPLTNNAGLPSSFNKLVERSLIADAMQRPGLDEVENELWLSLVEVSRDWAAGVRMQIEYFDSFAPQGESRKPSYMDECIEKLREFYSQT